MSDTIESLFVARYEEMEAELKAIKSDIEDIKDQSRYGINDKRRPTKAVEYSVAGEYMFTSDSYAIIGLGVDRLTELKDLNDDDLIAWAERFRLDSWSSTVIKIHRYTYTFTVSISDFKATTTYALDPSLNPCIVNLDSGADINDVVSADLEPEVRKLAADAVRVGLLKAIDKLTD